jgi:peptide/nickel transport system substrate-binding protein
MQETARAPFRRRLGWCLLSAVMVLVPFFTWSRVPPTHAAATRVGKSTLVVAWWLPVDDLDPATSYSGTGAMVLRGLYDTLVRMKGASTTKVVGDLATSWSSSRHFRVWTFHLRHNVRFHDGTRFDAAAAKKSIDRVLTLDQGPAIIDATFVKPSGVRVIGPYTLRFTLKHPSDLFLRALAAQWGNWIISPKALARPPKNLHTWLQTHDAGTGPYQITRYVPAQSVVLSRFPGYWAGWSGHHVSRIIINSVTTDATRRELLEKGDADLTTNLTPQDLNALSQNPRVRVDTRYGMRNVALVMTDGGPLASPLARRAMCYAFSYNGFVNGLLKGYARQAQGPLPRTIQGHDFSLPMYHTNLDKARALLHKAGVAKGTKMTVWFESGDEVKRDVALVMQAQLAQLGIQLQVQAQGGSTFGGMFFGNAPVAQRPNFFVWYWYPDYNDPGDWLYPQYESSQKGSAGSNGGFYHNATVDRLLTEAQSVPQTKRRLALYKKVQQIVTWTDPASVFVADLAESTVYSARVHGYYLNPVYTGSFDFYTMWKS